MIEVKDVSKSFLDTAVLQKVSIHINEGEIFGIIGRSGAGKSTLLRCLNGLEEYDEGSIVVMGKEVKKLDLNGIRALRKDMGMIFQSFNLLNTKNVYDNVALPLEIWKKDKKYIKDRVTELLNLVGLSDKIKSMPRELSGGQKQRVAIARALTLEPKILLCDEATSALDPGTTKSILALIKEINEKLNITVVMVTHQMEVIKEICNRVALIEDGEIKICGLVKDLFLRPEGELKKLLCGDEVLPTQGVNIKIFFPGEVSENSIITSMARELDMDFSIVWGKLENFRQEVLGSLIINVEVGQRDRICNYLDKKSIGWEVI
ncbi:Methionine import ATP-binding protein MetN [Clostridium liquoris]|uniref:Methionine import ATP-binding protein MetN n=1 Tax=Clostridium liquoris TaxID=1289519 RepID=A0A2T0B2H3_9CLOT|nr:methionine ABC transporter ATP-binding protein [Clostridium liquoris]PRR77957.1 Methionine import ATP-binding protein MetN [Clostridium liquoris]